MSTAVRIYIVSRENGDNLLVKATNQAQALRHVARHTFSVKVASAVQVGDMMASGAEIVDATTEPVQEAE